MSADEIRDWARKIKDRKGWTNAERAEERNELDFVKIESVLVDGWQNIYENLDDEHKRAFWRSFISEIHINWHGATKEIKDVIFF